MNARQTATILAALRYWQFHLTGESPGDDFADIARDNGRLAPLSADEIDDLCMQVNAPRGAVSCEAMLARTLAALETPGDLTDEEKRHVIEDAAAALEAYDAWQVPMRDAIRTLQEHGFEVPDDETDVARVMRALTLVASTHWRERKTQLDELLAIGRQLLQRTAVPGWTLRRGSFRGRPEWTVSAPSGNVVTVGNDGALARRVLFELAEYLHTHQRST